MRVASSARAGRISALLKTLGTDDAGRAQAQGPLIDGLKDRVTSAIATRKTGLGDAALDARLRGRDRRCHVAGARPPTEIGRIHPISQVIDEITAIFADMGFAVAEGPDIETDDLQLHQAELPRRPSGAGDARHVLFQSEAGRLAHVAAHAYVAGADAHHAAQKPPIRPSSRPHLSPIAIRPTRRCFIRSRGW